MTLFPHILFVVAFIVLQFEDVASTNAALRQPDVVEVGDTKIGLGNAVGWAQRRLGWWWWIIKLPLIAVAAPLLWTPVPWAIEPAVSILLLVVDAYFLHIVRQNYVNAKPKEERVQTCRPMP